MATDIPANSVQAVEPIVLKLSASDVKSPDLLSKADTRIVIYSKRPDEKKFTPIGSTELIWDSANPKFTQNITVPWSYGQGLIYRANILECDYVFRGHEDPMPKTTKNTININNTHFWIYKPKGHVDFSIDNLLATPGGTFSAPAISKKGVEQNRTQITITALKFPASSKKVCMRFKIKKFKKANWLLSSIDKDDMYCQVVVNPGTAQEAGIYTTKIDFDTQSPKYERFEMPFGLWGQNVDTNFEIRVYRFKSKHGVDLVGKTDKLNLAELLLPRKKGASRVVDTFSVDGKHKDVGDLVFKEVDIQQDPGFKPELNCNPDLIHKAPSQFPVFLRDFKK